MEFQVRGEQFIMPTAPDRGHGPVAPSPGDPEMDEILARLEFELARWRAEQQESWANLVARRYEELSTRLREVSRGHHEAIGLALERHASLPAAERAEVETLAWLSRAPTQPLDRKARVGSDRGMRAALTGHNETLPVRFQAFVASLTDPEGELFADDGEFQGWKYLLWIHTGRAS